MAETGTAPDRGTQTRLIAIVFGVILLVLALSYYFLLRSHYVELYRDLRPADASAIVTELDRRGIAYELRDGGATILVPENEASQVRLAIAGSDLPLGGLVGFELFNESDLGLTDFAQKINYQRALQGELARTIMMMDGVESARVHLAIPERSLFRGNRSETRAAVTVVARRGAALDEARVGGIQRLVASSVPELALANVAILDGMGRVISAASAGDGAMPPAMEERAGVQTYYRARIRNALEPIIPSHTFDVRVTVLSGAGVEAPARAPAAGAAPAAGGQPADATVDPTAAAGGGRRQFRLAVTVLTSEPVAPDRQALVANAVRAAADIDDQAGDRLVFAVGPVDFGATAAPPRAVAPGQSAATFPDLAVAPSRWPSPWILVSAALALVSLLLLLRARRARLLPAERETFAERLRLQLAAEAEQRGA
jgi:flagellar M-ring protein FliF